MGCAMPSIRVPQKIDHGLARRYRSGFFPFRRVVRAVNGVSFSVEKGNPRRWGTLGQISRLLLPHGFDSNHPEGLNPAKPF